DADWSPVFANRRELEYTGLTSQEAQSKDAVARIFHPEDFKKLELLRKCMSSEGASSEMEARIRGKDGQYRWFLIRDNPLRDEQGRVIRWYGTRTDIQDRKRAEEALHKAQILSENFFEFSPNAILVTDGNGRITKVNSELEKAFGYSRTELEGLAVETLMPERFRAVHPKHREHYGAHARVRPMGKGLELYGRRKDGAEFPVDIMLSPIGTADHPIFLCVIQDVSEKKRVEEAIRKSDEQLRNQAEQSRRELQQIIDAVPQQVFVFDADWSPLFANQRELEYTGLTAQESQSKDAVARIFHPEDFRKLEVLRERMSSEGVSSEMEARIRGKDGQYRWFLIRDNPLRDEQGRVLRWYGTRTDIEDRKRAEEALRKAQADLAHFTRIATMGEFAASIAHEVNQPISGIVINAKTCLRWLAGASPNLDEAREAARRIIRDGTRAGDIVARIRASVMRTATAKDRLDMNDAIREIVGLALDEVLRNSVILRTELADDLSPVLGDRTQLQQVVLNLVINGVQAMSTVAGRARELVIRTQNDEAEQVRVTVQDSGTGLDPQIMQHIFDPFYTTKPGGMGMGLSISRSIIQNHGGRLWAVPNEGPGTTFHFMVPKYH
ncbi:MAG TPA: PAS domain S-box protein, partial [Terriglobales bacterium]|nr:PAS domain S-box protein [Terriglobales bacterium]